MCEREIELWGVHSRELRGIDVCECVRENYGNCIPGKRPVLLGSDSEERDSEERAVDATRRNVLLLGSDSEERAAGNMRSCAVGFCPDVLLASV